MAYELGHEDVGPPQLLAGLFDERVRARVPTLPEEARRLGARAARVLLRQQPVDGAPATLEERGADRRLPRMECMCSVHGSCAPSARVQETGRLKAYAVYMQCVCSAYAGCLQRMQPLGRAQPAVHLVVKGVDGSAVRTAVELQHGTPQPLDLAAARLHREQAVSNAKHPGRQTN